ncbi:MAG: hypothetical protein GOV02_00395 [Candidatus Aenigmarchaeota archaeon]|nr:hypothetical protein [Candidatus Aenigmarchaeota archaeon]
MKTKYFSALIGLMLLLSVQIVAADPVLQISSTTTPGTISPGNDGYIEVIINNVGTDTAGSLSLRLADIDSPIIPLTPSYLDDLGSLEGGSTESAIFRFSVPASASSGFYTAQFMVRYCTGSVCKDHVEYSLITVQSPTKLELTSVSPEQLQIGQNNEVGLTIKNTGESSLNNIFVSWEASDNNLLPFASDNEFYLPSLAGGQATSIPFDIYVDRDTEAGVYPVELIIEYNDASGADLSMNTSVGLKVAGDINFIISQDDPDELFYGMPGIATFTIYNIGTASAEFLSVIGESSYGTDTVYVGSIDSDDEESVDIRQDLSGASGPYDMKLTINYKDSFGNVQTFEENVSTRASTVSGGFTNIIVVVVVLFGVYWFWWRKRKKK